MPPSATETPKSPSRTYTSSRSLSSEQAEPLTEDQTDSLTESRVRTWSLDEDAHLIEVLEQELQVCKLTHRFPRRTYLAIIKRVEHLVRLGRVQPEKIALWPVVKLWFGLRGDKASMTVVQSPLKARRYYWTLKQDKSLFDAFFHRKTLTETQLRFPPMLDIVDKGPTWRQRRLRLAEYAHALGSAGYGPRVGDEDPALIFYHEPSWNLKVTPNWMVTDQSNRILFLGRLAETLAKDEDESIALCDHGLSKTADDGLTWTLAVARKHPFDEKFRKYSMDFVEQIWEEDETSLMRSFVWYRREWIRHKCQLLLDSAKTTTDHNRHTCGSQIFGMSSNPPTESKEGIQLARLERRLDECGALFNHPRKCDTTCRHTNRQRLAIYLDHLWDHIHRNADLSAVGLHRLIVDCYAIHSGCDLEVLIGKSLQSHIQSIGFRAYSILWIHKRFHTIAKGKPGPFRLVLRECPSPPSIDVSGTMQDILNKRAHECEAPHPESDSFQKLYPEALMDKKRTMYQHPAITLILNTLADNGKSRAPYLAIGVSRPLCPLCVDFISAVNRLDNGEWWKKRACNRRVLHHRHTVFSELHDWLLADDVPPALAAFMEVRLMGKVDETLRAIYQAQGGTEFDSAVIERKEISEGTKTGEKRKRDEAGEDKVEVMISDQSPPREKQSLNKKLRLPYYPLAQNDDDDERI